MHSYFLVLKHLQGLFWEIKASYSLEKCHLRGSVNFKNSWLVKLHKNRFTNVIRSTDLTLGINFITDNRLNGLWFSTRMYWKPQIINPRSSNQLTYWTHNFNCSDSVVMGNFRNPKRGNPYGSGGLVRRLGYRRFFSNSSIKDFSCASLKELMKINKKNPKCTNDKLIHVITDPDVLLLSYELIKSNPGNSTPGSDKRTLDKINANWFANANKLLKAGKYNFKPARRVYIQKKGNLNADGSKKFRMLSISSPRDKIIQQAMYLVLSAVYEPSFLESSHGSRPDKGNHSALHRIKFNMRGVKWCIEADIENNFPSISHKILLSILSKRIKCSKFLALVKKSIKVGYKEKKKLYESNRGLFQGNIISPILNNIYLHELDVFINELSKSFFKGKYRRKNPKFRKIAYLMEKADTTLEIKRLRRSLWKIHSKDPLDPNFKRLYYTRYVDDFIVGIIGSRKESVEIQNKIEAFLKNKLNLILNKEKTIITNFSKNFIYFLGTYIKGEWERNKRVKIIARKGIKFKARVSSRVVLKAPIKKLFEKATINGFFKKKHGKFNPTNVGWLINLDHADIIKFFNSVIRGNLNYYSFANNRKSLGSFIHGLKWSCARTLALKFKLRYSSKVFRKFGSKLKCSKSGVQLFLPDTFKAIKIFGINEPTPDDVLFKKWHFKVTKSNLKKSCIICGSNEQIEMHHVRKIRDLKLKAKSGALDFFTYQMAAINRKQVPLCSNHHKKLHYNNLSNQEIELFKAGLKNVK